MQIAIYAIRTSEKWECHLSLDMQVDLQWWYGVKRSTDEKGSACSLVLLSTQIPLGWAVVIQERFRSIQDMDQWGNRIGTNICTRAWLRFCSRSLKEADRNGVFCLRRFKCWTDRM